VFDDFKYNYQGLASAIIVEACEDYKRGKMSEEGFYSFCHSNWIKILMGILECRVCDGEWLYENMKKEKEEYEHEFKRRKHI